MNFWKRLKRGYNQADIMANYISKKNNIFYQKNLIKKVKNTRQQSHLSRQERGVNIENCFKINKNYIDIIDKKYIIIVDDVVST
jgi:predicted amidophosphoribosyltransferase